jgi:hypothetical protein
MRSGFGPRTIILCDQVIFKVVHVFFFVAIEIE